MPGGFEKKTVKQTAPAIREVGKPGKQTGGTPANFDGRENMRGGANYQEGDGERDQAERLYRDRRSA
jgi:hypothetical protein